MKVKVVKPFCDKFNLTRTFDPGEVVDFEEKRAEDIVNRGLGEYFVPAKPKKAETPVEKEPETPVEEKKESAVQEKKPVAKKRQKKEN